MALIFKDFSTGYSKNEVINKINFKLKQNEWIGIIGCLLYTSPSPRDATLSRMPSSA